MSVKQAKIHSDSSTKSSNEAKTTSWWASFPLFRSPYALWVLALMTIAYILNQLNRYILGSVSNSIEQGVGTFICSGNCFINVSRSTTREGESKNVRKILKVVQLICKASQSQNPYTFHWWKEKRSRMCAWRHNTKKCSRARNLDTRFFAKLWLEKAHTKHERIDYLFEGTSRQINGHQNQK